MNTRAEILAGLAEILEECAGIKPDEVTEDARFAEDLNIDSLAKVEILVAAADHFEVFIPDATDSFKTVGDLVDCITTAVKA